MRALLLVICLMVLIIPGGISYAQFNLGGLTNNPIEITLDPAFPEPNDSITVSLSNFLSSFYGSEIIWRKNGEEIPDTRNLQRFDIVAGGLGESTSISVTLIDQNGGQQTIAKIINPLYLDLIIEPQTHVPSFYEGRPLPSSGSQINATALLFGANAPNGQLIYTWRVNNEVLSGVGQRGQSKVSFETPLDTQTIVSVEVSTLNGEILTKRSDVILSVRPELYFYEVHTLYGIIERPFSNFPLIGNSATLRAEPFYLDSRVFNDPNILSWEVDNQEVPSAGNPYDITIQRTQNRGSSRLAFQVQSTTQFLQGVKSSLTVTY